MSDELKKWVEEDRSDFDLYKTDHDVLWGEIEAALDKTGERPWRRLYFVSGVAASLVILFGVGWALFSGMVWDTRDGYALREISPELAETEYYYAERVSQMMHLIEQTEAQIDPSVFEDLTLLDSAYQELKHDLRDNVDNEEVIDAMIQNYRIKLKILEHILEQIKDDHTEPDEKTLDI